MLYPPADSDIPIVSTTNEITNHARQAIESSGQMLLAQQKPSSALKHELVTKAVTEAEALGDADDILNSHRQEFREFQNRVNTSSAQAPSYQHACTALFLDFEHLSIVPSVEGRQSAWVLLPHQVQAISWLAVLLKSELRGGICADKMGFGKTIFALASLIFFQPAASASKLVELDQWV